MVALKWETNSSLAWLTLGRLEGCLSSFFCSYPLLSLLFENNVFSTNKLYQSLFLFAGIYWGELPEH